MLSLDESCFDEPGSYYRFTYAGSIDTVDSDYEYKTFLGESSSLRQCFQLGYSSSVPGLNQCEFVPRNTTLLGQSNVLEWPAMADVGDDDDEDPVRRQILSDRLLPPRILGLHSSHQWGHVAEGCRSITAEDISLETRHR